MTGEAKVPFFRVDLGEEEIEEVISVLRSGWLTTGPKVREFEENFAARVGAKHAIAVSSCTAAMHLAVEALGLSAGQGVLVPTMTFAATAEIVRYQGAIPILVDCDETTMLMDLDDAKHKLLAARTGSVPGAAGRRLEIVGIIPVHVGGLMLDCQRLRRFADEHRLWIVEDAAHSFPASRLGENGEWIECGRDTAEVTCFSFYANKTITTGEGGMAVCSDDGLAERMRVMGLHGLSRDAWKRYQEGGSWDYRVVAPGFKYNLTDIAAAIGIHQLRRADEMRAARSRLARTYLEAFAGEQTLDLPPDPAWARQSWHLFLVRLREERLSIGRDRFIEELSREGIGTSVHWRPLHLHPYYCEDLGWSPEDCPMATRVWSRIVTLPLFPTMRDEESRRVVEVVRSVLRRSERGS